MVLLVSPADTERIAETVQRLGQTVDLRLQTTPEPVRAAFSIGLIDDIAPEMAPDEILIFADERMFEHKRERLRSDPGWRALSEPPERRPAPA